MAQPANLNHDEENELNTPVIASILHGNEPQENHSLQTMTIAIMPGHSFHAHSIEAGVTFVSINGTNVSFGTPMHNLTITAADDGSLSLGAIGFNPPLFEE